MADKLFPQERLEQIMIMVKERGRVSVIELGERFGVSTVTIRNDLATLEQQGVLMRTHGGAVTKPSAGVTPVFTLRRELCVAEKESIGRAASELVRDGDAIALDDSTTAWHLAQHLKDRHELTIVTNSLFVAESFLHSPGVTVVMPGGILRPVSASLVGEQGDVILERYHVQKGFFGARGFTLAEGLTDPDQYGAELKRRLVERSKEVIAIVDSTKWGQVTFASFASLKEIDRMITNNAAPANMVAALRKHKIKVTIV